MIFPNKLRILFKSISALVAGIFLWQQIAWASEYYYGLPTENDKNSSGFMTAERLAESQSRQETLVARLQADLAWRLSNSYTDDDDWALQKRTGTSGSPDAAPATESLPLNTDNVLSLSTAQGDTLNYKGQTLERIVQKDGTILEQVTLSETGDILSGVVRYMDGTVVTVEEGKIKSYLAPDGTATHYDADGRIAVQVAVDGLISYYDYQRDGAGNIIRTTVIRPDSISEYDESLRLSKVTKIDGAIQEYVNGIISRLQKPDGKTYIFVQTAVTLPDGTPEIKVSLNKYIDPQGITYTYQDDSLNNYTVQFPDNSVQIIENAYLTRLTKPDGTIIDYERDLNGVLLQIIVTSTTGIIFHYSSGGLLTKKIEPNGTTYNYTDGLVTNKVYPNSTIANYIREYDLAGNPLRILLKEPSGSGTTYLFNAYGVLAAIGTDLTFPGTTPFNKPKSSRLEAQGYMQSSGVLATDGTYLYIKRWGNVAGSNIFEKVGTGYNGTIAGENYGTLSTSSLSYSATYYQDGNIYNPVSTNAAILEKINVTTGAKTNMTLSSGLLERSSGTVKTGYSLITSDGRYVYNLAYHINNGGTTYNGWTVKVYDPLNSWSVVKTFTTGTTSFCANGIVSDGTYLYAIQWTNTNSAKVQKINLATNTAEATFTINQLTTNAVNGQYDWVNKKFYLGSYTKPDIYRYNQDLVNYTPLVSGKQEMTFKAESVLNSAGVLVTDGTYYYVKRSGTALGLDAFQKIGTGLNGTIAGKNYGALSASSNSYSAAYYSDGFIYNPVSTNALSLEKINVTTGLKSTVTLSSGLIERASAIIKSGAKLITSDGRYVYNVAYHINNGGTAYNGWTVKVYDPLNNWSVVKTYTVGTASYLTGGIVADGIYLYFIESKNTDAARVTISRISDGVIVKTYTINQGQTAASGGQYDWMNNKIILGASSNNGTYTYDGLVRKTELESIDTVGFFAASGYAVLSQDDANPYVPGSSPADKTAIESDVQSKELIYTQGFKLKKALQYDGTIINFKDSLVDSVVDKDGNSTAYAYEYSNLGDLLGLDVTRAGSAINYSLDGTISRFSNSGLTFTITGDTVSRIEKDDGTVIENAVFDSNNNIINARITKPDGVVAIYNNGALAEVNQPDGNKVYYDDAGNLTRFVNQKGIIYDYSTIEEGGQSFIIAAAVNPEIIQDEEEPVYIKYNGDKKPVQVRRENGQVLDYTYNKDAAGKIISTVMTDGKSVTTYDANDNISRQEIIPTPDDPLPTISEYEYGRIRRVYKQEELIYRYAYEFDNEGKEIAVIEDVKTGDMKRYKDELLVSVTDKNDLVTTYEYTPDKKISKSQVTRSGKLINSYSYTYTGDLTTIEDIDKVKRTYDQNDKMVYLEEGNKTYAYTYLTGDDGKESTVQELKKVKDDSGNVTNYKDGSVESIVKPNGEVIRDLVFADGTVKSYTIEKNGNRYFIEGDRIVGGVKSDGSVAEYYPNGWLESLVTPDGKKASYYYEVAAEKSSALSGTAQDAVITTFEGDDALELAYYSDPTNSLLLHLDSMDSFEPNHPATFNGNAHLDAANAKFGPSSLALDGNGDYLTLPNSDDWNFGTGDFTVEAWVYRTEAGYSGVIQNGELYSDTNAFGLVFWDGGLNFRWNLNPANGQMGVASPASYPGINGWHHVAAVRNGNSITVYSDGVGGAPVDVTGVSIGTTGKDLRIGRLYYTTPSYLTGYIDELRVSKGIARWTSNFTPLNSEYRLYKTSGSFTSNPIELNATELNTISWNELAPDGTDITIQTRTGNTVTPDDGTWSAWSGPLTDSAGSNITSPAARYIQYKVNMTTADAASTPQVTIAGTNGITISYIEAGSGEVVYITVEKDGIRYRYTRNELLAEVGNLKFDLDEISAGYQLIGDGALADEVTIKTNTFKQDLVSGITTPDGVVIKYFNNKPVSITNADGGVINNIVSTADTTDTGVTASFTAKNTAGDIYTFKDDLLVEIKRIGGAVIINPAPDTFSAAALALVEAAFFPDTLAGEKEYKASDISINNARGGKVTYFIDGKMASTYQRYDTGEFKLLTDYMYDEAGNLILVRLPYARDSIDKEIADARLRISIEKANYLRMLAEQGNLAYSQIQAQVQSVREEINAERARLQSMRYQQVTRSRQRGWWIFSWTEYYTETVEIPEVRNALNQLDEQERILNNEEAEAYAALNGQLLSSQEGLIQDEANSLAEVSRQEELFRAKIIEEEATPIILDNYRAILGRDPDDSETQYWLSKVDYNSKINVNELRGALQSSSERVNQEAVVSNLKSQVADFLNNYLALDQAGRDTILQSLGLTGLDAVALDREEVDGILAFLDKQNIHFGRSAFVSLEALLKDAGIVYNFEDLALKTILVDIFTGSINSLSDGKLLELSMYSLSRVASLYGLTLYNTKLNFDDLKGLSPVIPVIAHLKNNHFVVVTNIAADGKVTYKELNRGQNGYTWTVSKDDFQNSWTGYAIVKGLSHQVDPALNGTVPNGLESKVISDWQAQRVKGSCLPFLIPLIAAIFSGIAAIGTAVVGVIGAIVTGISAILGPIITAIGTFISGVANFMVGIGTAIFNAVSFVGTSLLGMLGPVGGWLSGVGSFLGNAFGLGGIITSTGFNLTALGAAIGKTVVLGALSFGATRGLEALGVNPAVSSLISSFVTGGVGGFMSGAGFLVGGLQGLAMQGVNQLGAQLGIPPAISSVVGMAAGTLIGAGLNGTWAPIFDQNGLEVGSRLLHGLDAIGYSLGTTVLPNVASELAYYGVQQLGTLAGIDPRISYLAGIGIRSSINMGLSGATLDEMWTSVKNGLISGVANVSLEWASEALDLDPTISRVAFSAIAGAIEGLFGVPQYDPVTGTYIKPNSIFEGVFNAYKNNVLSALGVGMGNDPWKQSAYLAQILDFSDIVKRDGLAVALNTYAAGIFNQAAIGSIVNLSGSVGNYFTQKIANHDYAESNEGGLITRNYGVEDFGYIETAFDEFGNEYVTKVSIMGNTREGNFGIDAYSRFGLKTGELATRFGDEYLMLQRIENGEQAYAEIKDWYTGETLLVISPSEIGGYNVYNDYGDYVDAIINNYRDGYSVSLKDGYLDFPDAKYIDFIGLTTGERDSLKEKFNVTDQQLDEMLNMMRQAVGNETSINGSDFFVTPAFADEIVGYQKNRVDQIANSMKNNNPTVWQKLGGFFEKVGYNISHAGDYIASHYFGKSDPAVINRVYNRIVDENISFYNGTSYPGEVSLTIDPEQQFYGNLFGGRGWYTDDQMVVVRYQDKWAVFGVALFDALEDQGDLDLDSPAVRDALGQQLNGTFKDPNARVQVEKYFSVLEAVNAWKKGIDAFTGEDGVYHVIIERNGNYVGTPTDPKRWFAYSKTNDTTGKPIPIQDKEFLLDLIRRSRGN